MQFLPVRLRDFSRVGLFASALFSVLPAPLAIAAQQPAAPAVSAAPAPARKGCKVNQAEPSAAEAALSREEYASALDLFAAMKATDPVASRAGTIRTLIEQNKVEEARTLAEAWAKETGQDAATNSVAQETYAEVLLRGGELPESYALASRAFQLDTCNARAYLLMSEVESFSGFYLMSRNHVTLAHRLHPHDPAIRNAWIRTLPRTKRLEELLQLSKDETLLNSKDRERLADSVAHAGDYSKEDCKLVTPTEHARIPIEKIMNGPSYLEGLALDVNFNGKKRRLELDTGASGLTLSRSAAARLGLTRERTIQIGGIGDKGEVATSVAHVASVKIGPLEFKNCVVAILEKSSALDIDGLIGGDVFSDFLLSIDYPKEEVRVDPLPPRPDATPAPAALKTAQDRPATEPLAGSAEEPEPVHDRYIAPEMKDWTRIYRNGHELLLPVSVGENKDRLFIVDTGASTMLISPEAARRVTKVHGGAPVTISGLSGEVRKVSETEKFTFYFAHLKQDANNILSVDTTKFSHDDGVEISGFMGAPILRRLTIHIDYRDNLMKFDYDPKDQIRVQTEGLLR